MQCGRYLFLGSAPIFVVDELQGGNAGLHGLREKKRSRPNQSGELRVSRRAKKYAVMVFCQRRGRKQVHSRMGYHDVWVSL